MRKKDPTTIIFKNEDLLNKKLITSFLINNDVDLVPTNNNYSEYQAVIKVRELGTPTTPSKSPGPKENVLLKQINDMYAMIGIDEKNKSKNKKKKNSDFEYRRIDNIKTPELRGEDSIIDNDRYPVNTKDLLIKAIKIQSSPKKKSPQRSPKKSPKNSLKQSPPKKFSSNDNDHFSFVYSSDDRERDIESINKIRNSIRRTETESIRNRQSSRKSSPKSPKSPTSPLRSPKSPRTVKQFSVESDDNYYSSYDSKKKYSEPFSIKTGQNKRKDDLDENSPAGKLRYYHSQESQAERESRHSSSKRGKDLDSSKNRSSDDPDFSEVRVGKNYVERKNMPLQESKGVNNQMNIEQSPKKKVSIKEADTSKSSNSKKSDRMSSNQHNSDREQFYEDYNKNYLSPQDLDDFEAYSSIDFRKQLDKLRAINEALQNKNQIRQEPDEGYEAYLSGAGENLSVRNYDSGTKKVPRNSYAQERKSSPKNERIFKDISITNIPAAEGNLHQENQERMGKKNYPSVSADSVKNYDSRLKAMGKKLNVPDSELKSLDLVLKKLFPTQDPLMVIKLLAATSEKQELPTRIGDLPKSEEELYYASKSSKHSEESFLERVRVRDIEHRSPGHRILESQKYESPKYKSPRSQSPPNENLYRYYELKSKLAQKNQFNPNFEVKRELSSYDNLFLIKSQLGIKKTPLTPKNFLTKSPARSKSPKSNTSFNAGNSSMNKQTSRSPKVLQTPKSAKSPKLNKSVSEKNELDDDEGWIDIKKLEKENRVAKQNISDLVFYGKKAVESRKKFIDNEKNFKIKHEENEKIKRSQSPIFKNKKNNLVNTTEVLAYKHNIHNLQRLNEKKEIARKYSDFSQKSIENAITYYDQQESEIERVASPVKQGRLEGMSSFDILRYHQLKLKKAQCLQVDYVRKVNKESHSYSQYGDEGEGDE